MKKELLTASALAATLVLPGVATAASMSMSGSSTNGVTSNDADSSSNAAYSATQDSGMHISVSETTDGGTTIASGFTLVNEGGTSATESGLTLTFTDGSSLELIDAGTAYAGALASVPSASGEQGLGATCINTSSSSLTWASKSAAVGFDWNSAADFMGVDGLTFGLSMGLGDDATASTVSVVTDTGFSVGATYVTTAGDSTVTIGGGYVTADGNSTGALNANSDAMAISATAVTGDLTVGVGFSSGEGLTGESTASINEIDDVEVMNVGAKYVSGDMTFTVSYKDGESKSADLASEGTSADSQEVVGASVDYAVASGVTATLGYENRDDKVNGTAIASDSGSSVYLGAKISF